MHFAIPVISAMLFRFGGSDQWEWCILNQKLWRWLMGAIIGLLCWHGWIAYGFLIGSYFLSTNLFGYGDKTPILRFLPQNIKHLVSGIIFGLASFPVLGYWSILQALISGAAFYFIEVKGIDNPFAEWGRGFFGTILFVIT